MRKTRIYLLLALFLAACFLLYSCGSGGGGTIATIASGGITVVGQSNRAGAKIVQDLFAREISFAAGDFSDVNFGHFNPWYRDAAQIPSTFTVGITDCRILPAAAFLGGNGGDDPASWNYNIAGFYALPLGGTYSVSSPKIIDLGSPQNLAETSSLPSPGTYPYFGTTLIYVQFTIQGVFDSSGIVKNRTLRLYASTVSPVLAGDVLIYDNGVWNWINNSDGSYTPITSSRPGGTASGWNFPNNGLNITGAPTAVGSVVQDTHWSIRASNTRPAWMVQTSDPYQGTLNLASPVVIEAGKKYTMTMTFDLTKTNNQYWAGHPAATGGGIFVWDDINADGVFKPAIDDNTGAYGQGDWAIEAPTITITAQQVQ